MQSETYIIELTLVGVPLPKDREDAYWDAIRVVVEMVMAKLSEAQSLDGGGLRSEANAGMTDALSVSECSTVVLV